MSGKNVDSSTRVVYVRDAKIFPSLDHQTMDLGTAVDTAIANHQPGEAPVIIGNSVRLIGIDAIRSAWALKQQRPS